MFHVTAGVSVKALSHERWGVSSRRVAMGGLAVRRLLMREHGAGTRAFVDAALRAAGVHPREMLEVASLEALKRMAEASVAAVP